MNQFLIMGILQRGGELLHIWYHQGRAQRDTSGITLTQRTVGSVLHHQKRHILLHTKVQDTYNMRMVQSSQGTRLRPETGGIILSQLGEQHFNRSLALQIQMFTQVDFRKPTFSQQTRQLIIAKLLSYTISHQRSPQSCPSYNIYT